MTTTAEKNAGTGASSGTPAWTTPGNITAEDSNYAVIASASFPPAAVSGELRATNFGFAAAGVGASDTVDGVTMRFKREASRTQQQDHTIKLFWSGAVQGNNKAVAADWPNPFGSETFATYGGAADTWGSGVTATDVRSSGFGCSIKATNTRAIGPASVRVNVVKMTITYTEVAVGPQFFAQVIGVLPILRTLILPLLCRTRTIERTARLIECYP